MIKRLIEFLVFIMIVMSSRAIVDLLLAGGAVNQTAHLETASDDNLIGFLMLNWKLAILLIIALLLLTKQLRKIRFDSGWVSLIVLCFLSIFWADYPREVRVSALMLLFSYVLVLLHFEMCGWQRAMYFLKNVFLFITFLSVGFVLFIPSYGISVGEHAGKWQGVFSHKNELGSFASMTLAFFLSWYKFDKRISTKIGIMFSVILMIGSGSSTTYACLVIVSVLFLILHFSKTRKLTFSLRYVLLVTVAGICAYAIYMSINSSSLLAIGEKNTSFSNRNFIWTFIFMQIMESPWVGHGLEQISASVTSDSSSFLENVGFVVGTAHNGFIDTLHALGVFGLLLVTMLLVKPLRLEHNVPEFDFIFIFLIVFVVQNMFSSYLLGFNIYIIMLMYVSCLSKFMTKSMAESSYVANPEC